MIKKQLEKIETEKESERKRSEQPKQDYLNRMKDERVVGTTYVGPPFFFHADSIRTHPYTHKKPHISCP